MNATEFNKKYEAYIEDRFDGLEFDIPVVTEYLDKVFEELIKVEGFMFAQIKLKYGTARFYCDKSINLILNLISIYISW